MIRPRAGGRSLGRLLPPAIRRDDVHPPISVNVPGADSMLRHDPIALLRNRMDDPRRGRIRRIGTSPADRAAAHKDNVGLSIAIDVLENRYFGINGREDVVLVPATQFPLWVDVERHRPAIGYQNIRPAIAGIVER